MSPGSWWLILPVARQVGGEHGHRGQGARRVRRVEALEQAMDENDRRGLRVGHRRPSPSMLLSAPQLPTAHHVRFPCRPTGGAIEVTFHETLPERSYQHPTI